MKLLIAALWLSAMGCFPLLAGAPPVWHELPAYVLGPPGGVWSALDSFYAFRSALSREDWAAAASLCVEDGPRPDAARAGKLREFLPAKIRDPATKVVVLSIDSTGGHMRLGLGMLTDPAHGQHVIAFRKIGGRWLLLGPR